MDENSPKSSLHEVSNSSSDGECLPSAEERSSVPSKLLESAAVDPSQNEASSATAENDDSLQRDPDFSSGEKCLPNPRKRPNHPRQPEKGADMASSPKESAAALTGYACEDALQENSNSSSDVECVPSPEKRSCILTKPLESASMDPSPNECSEECGDALKGDSKCLSSPRKQPSIPEISIESTAMDPSPKESSTATAEYEDANPNINLEKISISKTEKYSSEISSTSTLKTEKTAYPQCDKYIKVCAKSSEKEVIDLSQEKSTSETTEDSSDIPSEREEDSSRDASEENTNSSSDVDFFHSQRKRKIDPRQSVKCAKVDPSPNGSAAATAGYVCEDALQENSNSSFDGEYLPSQAKRSKGHMKPAGDSSPKGSAAATAEYEGEAIENIELEKISKTKTEKYSLETSSTSTLRTENTEALHQSDRYIDGDADYLEINVELIDLTQEKSTSETEDSSDPSSETEEDSNKDADALESEYRTRYTSEYSRELLFAVEVMTIVRQLNELDFQMIIYTTIGEAPESPCDATLKQALGFLWKKMMKSVQHNIVPIVKGVGTNYKIFKIWMLKQAKDFERQFDEFESETFLFCCLFFSQCAAGVEKQGLSKAREFIPLLLCDFIHNLKDSGKIPLNFWEKIAKLACNINDYITLQEISNSPSDVKNLPSTSKQPKGLRQKVKCATVDPSPKGSAAGNVGEDSLQEISSSSSDIECLLFSEKQSNIPKKPLESASVDPSAEESTKVTGEYEDKAIPNIEPEKISISITEENSLETSSTATLRTENIEAFTKCDEYIEVGAESLEKEVIDLSQEKSTSETEASSDSPSEMKKDSSRDALQENSSSSSDVVCLSSPEKWPKEPRQPVECTARNPSIKGSAAETAGNVGEDTLQENSNSSSDIECVLCPEKQSNILKKPLESASVDPSPNESTVEYGDALKRDSKCLSSPPKQPTIPEKSIESTAMDPSPKESSTATAEYEGDAIQNIKLEKISKTETEKYSLEISSTSTLSTKNTEAHPQCDRYIDDDTDYLEVIGEFIDLTHEKSTSETEGSSDPSSETEKDSTKGAAALDLKYRTRYASEYSRELLFAIDVITLVRQLNELEFQRIIYTTIGEAPESPWDDTPKQVLRQLWEPMKKFIRKKVESSAEKAGTNYQMFQKLILALAKIFEDNVDDEKMFLMFCLVSAQFAVCAEKQGLTQAREFFPLVLCDFIQNMKDSGKFLPNFLKE